MRVTNKPTNFEGEKMNKNQMVLTLAIAIGLGLLVPDFAHAGLETSLMGIKSKLTGVILPLLSLS